MISLGMYYQSNGSDINNLLQNTETIVLPSNVIPSQNISGNANGVVSGISPNGKYKLSVLPPSQQKDLRKTIFNLVDLKQNTEKEITLIGIGAMENRGYVEQSFDWIDDSNILFYNRMPFSVWHFNIQTEASRLIFSDDGGRQGFLRYDTDNKLLWYFLDGKLHKFDLVLTKDTIIEAYSHSSDPSNLIIWSNKRDKFLKIISEKVFVVDANSGRENYIFTGGNFYEMAKYGVWSENDKRVRAYPYVYDLENNKLIDLKNSYSELSINLLQGWYKDDHLVVHNSKDGNWYLLNIFDGTYKKIVH